MVKKTINNRTNAQVCITGYGLVHSWGYGVWRKLTKVNMISFDAAMRIKLSNLYAPQGKVIPPPTFTHFTPRNSVHKCMNTSTMFENIMAASRFARLLMKHSDIILLCIA